MAWIPAASIAAVDCTTSSASITVGTPDCCLCGWADVGPIPFTCFLCAISEPEQAQLIHILSLLICHKCADGLCFKPQQILHTFVSANPQCRQLWRPVSH